MYYYFKACPAIFKPPDATGANNIDNTDNNILNNLSATNNWFSTARMHKSNKPQKQHHYMANIRLITYHKETTWLTSLTL